jgi:DNA-binding MarR family transcriptional regulator
VQTTTRTQELAADVAGLADSVMAFLGYAQKSSGEDFFRIVGELELSLSQLKLLMLLDREGEQHLKDLAEKLVLSLPAASRAVDGLHRRSAARLAGIETFIASLTTREQEDLARALAPIVARDEVAACIPKRTRP